ncbi:TRAP-type C4-dicarboxylate transport system substrate-binding protein [Variovorax boronicumulans]|nr:TRAP transporter substrate-binding protein DctP [Variovorax boronicumulans]MDQ0054677.1 TRAP-type C4-dicarboxylate transport system substrate-binding protein [Variovorax boronicumulans]
MGHLQWSGHTAYPRGTLPGIGLHQFAANLFAATSGSVTLNCVYESAGGAAALISKVADGQVDVGDLYCGGLSRIDSIFGVATLPFNSGSSASARAQLAVGRKAYETKFHELGVHLLYVTPWPPTGIWSARQIQSLSDLTGLRIRTYDDLSVRVFERAGAHAVELSIGQALEHIRNGKLDALLSSGDGVAGTLFREYLPHFYDIRYATPISFVVIHKPTYDRLGGNLREIVNRAAFRAERRLWDELDARILENEARMTDEGITMGAQLADEIMRTLLLCARAASVEERKLAARTFGESFVDVFIDAT